MNNNDNVIINTNDFADGLSSIKMALDKLYEIESNLKSIDTYSYGTKVDISNIKKINTEMINEIKNIFPIMSRTKVKIDDLLDNVNRMKNNEIDDNRKRIDIIKGLNPNVGGLTVKNAKSYLSILKTESGVNKVLDALKSNNSDTGSKITTNAISAISELEGAK